MNQSLADSVYAYAIAFITRYSSYQSRYQLVILLYHC